MTLTNISGTTTVGAKTLVRVRPRGFCAGVVRAVDIVELALEAYGAPVYVHHEIVHNRYVVDQLRPPRGYFRRDDRRGARGRCAGFQRAWRAAARARRSQGTQSASDRRHLPARDESASGGAEICARRAHADSDRPSRSPGNCWHVWRSSRANDCGGERGGSGPAEGARCRSGSRF